MRLFTAVLPPPAAVAELTAALAPVRRLPGARDLRWTATDGWHLTLAFLGEVPDDVRPELDERLARAARRHEPHTLRLAGAGHFGDSALWTGAEGDVRALSHLAGSVRAAARRAGAPPAGEQHAFLAHLTLARTPRSARVPLRPLVDALAAFQGSSWSVDTLALVASVPPRSGVPGEQPHYDTLAVFPLGRTQRPGQGPGQGEGPGGGPAGADG
ncbi:2'-5' RNA ligase [Actinacidiphila yanglinensis]|uniref:RNA 2',3'-cyclic phosphodiesterase n=1 Tax=Actinacidiphila yanglinensis TaxID=310779 RepID=A0A1H5Z6X6_9ACTN|nr:RNA 2',3'-cyclic phosphodiesterase [Actinacidiphila yanglinensis]SEG32128.1 2'-5' RNA ligase [Actinacidiphila yanglinensis]